MYYAGIGSRETPPEVLERMAKIGYFLARHGYTLRSGGAKGADAAFEKGCVAAKGKKEIFLSRDERAWAREEVQHYLDFGRDFSRFSSYVQGLLARNMMQVLGQNGDQPVQFVICWTPGAGDIGGTRYAIRCARAHNIPVYNLADPTQAEALHQRFLKLGSPAKK